ncbi:MAG: PQQ-like beta-propeller repeat protein, partial [Leptospiraceae bacterium]|nr:PQQ-like beta-propeller repeat protein [Leptospiraceae bacterium]
NVDWFEGNVGMLPDGTLIAPNDNYLVYGLDRETGERKELYFGNELMWSLPAVNPETGRMFSGSQFVAFQNVYAWNTGTGEKIWLSGGLGSNAASPLLTAASEDGALVLGGYDGIVRAYSQDNGKELWKFGTRDHIYASPAQQRDGTIIQASADGSVYALNPENGEMIWQYDTLEPIRSSPAIDGNGVIYVGSGEGKLFAINPDGTLRWAYQCITEVRNDLNGSPGLGYEGVYIAGESGEIFFVPYDYPLSQAGRKDPRSIQGPGEILPDEGVFLVWTGRFGGLQPEPPKEIDANEPIVLRIFVREKGDTILSSFDEDSLEVKFSGDVKPEGEPLVAMAANQRFLSLIPQETWSGPEGGELVVTLKGEYLLNHSRIGLKFYGGDSGGTFERTFRFRIQPRPARVENAATLPYRIPKEEGDPATALEFSRLAAPNPTMLPSWNQIGFDSLHYLAGFVESSGNKAILWVIPGKLDGQTGRTVTEPALEDRFVLELDYDGGLLSLHNYNPFILTFIGSWDMPFGKYRISTKADPKTGEIQRKAALNAMVLGDDLEFYGKFLKIMGLTDFWTGHMWVYGGMNAGYWNTGIVSAPDPAEVGTVSFRLEDGLVVADIKGGKFKKGEHVFGLLLVDASTGRPVQAKYARGIEVLGDESGHITSVKLPVGQEMPAEVRAYYMVDTYPAARGVLKAN